MLMDQQFFSNFYLHWFFSNLSFFERDPHMDSPEGIRVKFFSISMFASLQNKFWNYRTCSLCFDFESSLISTCLLRFENFFQTIERVRFASIFKFFNINMFASLRNKFSNFQSCSLRFDIEGNIVIKDFASLR